ncbi:cell division protein FtsK [Planosporangium flavigriseum]|uniref:Hypothetical cell division FtsK/SpoIIIE protein n=1 Tax=Planosporangium flavigriseum TaxID=373681 RepID=A0A8J3LU18_9ACTN|nr:FtsK/SpoIIIE domain-containing protein [Planosporangium flavigriseum]NJC66750.1 cell division protein FtsK [Planosporangium flavigriseum]GIG76543.1 hypothetical cell division FtsK/SpoIIIE protein [Planosporangium flavigriseum]
MPVINHVRGDQVPDSMLNVRTPVVKLPLWLVLTWWLLKGLALAVVLACRYWYATGPTVLLACLYVDFGWLGPVGLLVGLAALGAGWRFGHRASFERFGWWPALSRWRRWWYRRRWLSAMTTAKLTVAFDGHAVVPILKRVRSTGAADVLTVRMVTGQIPDDFARVSERLTHTFGARTCRVIPADRPDLVTLTLLRGDPLAAVVAPYPVPSVPDLAALPVARLEDGSTFRLRLAGSHVLIVGATGAGKGSWQWSLIAALAGGVRAGLVRLRVLDPKGGMEMAAGIPLFERFVCESFRQMADELEEGVGELQRRTARLRGRTRQHTPSTDEPAYVFVIDELAALTSYLTDRQLKDRIKAALGILLTQGRAVGVYVVAALQDPRKDVLPFRDLFPTRIGLRLTEAAQVDMVLGDGMRDRGALCDRIPMSMPGTAYVVLDGEPTPTRARASYWTDAHIADLAREYGWLRVVDGDWTEGGAA